MEKSRVYGYVRVSTEKQNMRRQIKNIKEEYPDAIIFEEAFTGTKMDRPKWNRLYKQLREGDTIVFDEVSRMSRNAEEGFLVYQDLYEKGVNLIFLKESTLNTENFRQAAQIAMTGTDVDCILEGINKYLMILAEKKIKAAFETAEHEVEFLHKRVSEGVRGAIARYDEEEALGVEHEKGRPGAQKGNKLTTKKSIKAKEEIKKHSKDFGGSLSDPDCMKLVGIARGTFYKYKRELKEELES